MDNNQVSDNLVGYTPSPDAIEEFNIITNNAPAEFGNFEGGISQRHIKSGTNQFHGDIFEFFRNDALNANTWANGNTTQPNLPVIQFSRNRLCAGTSSVARIGGPIKKDKLFFFADYRASASTTRLTTSRWNVFSTPSAGEISAHCAPRPAVSFSAPERALIRVGNITASDPNLVRPKIHSQLRCRSTTSRPLDLRPIPS